MSSMPFKGQHSQGLLPVCDYNECISSGGLVGAFIFRILSGRRAHSVYDLVRGAAEEIGEEGCSLAITMWIGSPL